MLTQRILNNDIKDGDRFQLGDGVVSDALILQIDEALAGGMDENQLYPGELEDFEKSIRKLMADGIDEDDDGLECPPEPPQPPEPPEPPKVWPSPGTGLGFAPDAA